MLQGEIKIIEVLVDRASGRCPQPGLDRHTGGTHLLCPTHIRSAMCTLKVKRKKPKLAFLSP